MARHKAPTKKQLTAMSLISKGMSPTQAMLKAGYSKSSSRIPKQALFKSAGVMNVIEQMQGQLLDDGITPLFLAHQLAKFAKSENPKVFAMAYDRISKIIGIEASKNEEPIKRQITLTEYLEPLKDIVAPTTSLPETDSLQDNLIPHISDSPFNSSEGNKEALEELII